MATHPTAPSTAERASMARKAVSGSHAGPPMDCGRYRRNRPACDMARTNLRQTALALDRIARSADVRRQGLGGRHHFRRYGFTRQTHGCAPSLPAAAAALACHCSVMGCMLRRPRNNRAVIECQIGSTWSAQIAHHDLCVYPDVWSPMPPRQGAPRAGGGPCTGCGSARPRSWLSPV